MSKSNTNVILTAVIVIVVVGGVAAVVFLPGVINPVEDQLKIAVLMPGNINDFAWNYEMYHSATSMNQAFPDVQIDVFMDLGQGAAVKDVMLDVQEEGYQIQIGHTFEYSLFYYDLIEDLADTLLFCNGFMTDAYANTFGLEGGPHEITYVLGYLAGSITKTGKIGYMDGYQFESTVAIANQFYLGAKAANSSANMTAVWQNTWEDQDQSREQCQALIDTGHDNIFARTSVPGAIQAGGGTPGVYIYGSQADQSSLDPTTVMACAISNGSALIQFIIETWQGSGFTNETSVGEIGPGVLEFGVAEHGVYWAPNDLLFTNTSIVSAQIQAEVLDVYESIRNGSWAPIWNGTQMFP